MGSEFLGTARGVRGHWPLLPLALLFLALATLYNVTTPLGEASEEPQHFEYVRYLTTVRQLPNPQTMPALWPDATWEAHQPPLYYLMVAAGSLWLDMANIPSWHPNPFRTWIGEPTVYYFLLHREDEGWPYHGLSLAVHWERLVTSLMGLVTVVATYWLAWSVLGHRLWAWAAAAVTAFTPGFLFTSATINNDSGAIMFSSLALLASVKLLLSPRPPWYAFLAYGLLLAAAPLSKRSGFYMVPLSALVLLLHTLYPLSSAPLRTRLLNIARKGSFGALFIYGLPILGGAWWYLRGRTPIETEYLSPQGMLTYFTHSWSRLWDSIRFLSTSYWGLFGWQSVFMDRWVYWLLGGVGLLAGAGLMAFLMSRLWRRQDAPHRMGILALLSGAAIALYIIFARFTVSPMPGTVHGRFLYPAIPALSLLLTIGIRQVLPRPALVLLFPAGLFALAVAAPFAYIAPAYREPPTPVMTQLPPGAIQHPQEVTFDNGILFLGYSLDKAQYAPGETMNIPLFWKTQRRLDEDFVAVLHLVNPGPEKVAGSEAVPLDIFLPPRQWQAGEIVRDERSLTVPIESPPGFYSLELGMYRREGGRYVGTSQFAVPARLKGDAAPRIRVDIGTVKMLPPVEAATIPHLTPATFGTGIRLLGYNFPTPQIGQTWPITLYWQATQELPADYTVFVHLYDSQGNKIAQSDSPPGGGWLPTSRWEKGDIIPDKHDLNVPPGIPPGEYRLVVGIYLLATMERLPVAGEGVAPGNSLLLTEVGIR